jgi:predicted unusual protein kinase regulating ubiquinone biosynthesis (AarF/ABC1/UbiB family)
MCQFNIMSDLFVNKLTKWRSSLSCILNNIWFLITICWIIFDELCLYYMFKDYAKCIDNLTSRLSNQNILYVKIFQAFALNNNMIDNETNNSLLKFTDNVPWTNKDIDFQTLIDLEEEYNIEILNDYKPINSGMISLVFKGIKKIHNSGSKDGENETVIIKMKRNNIENILNDGIQKLLFCIKLLSLIPINNYQMLTVIHNNIDLIKHQVNFNEEVENMIIMKTNCKNLKYIKIPTVQQDVTNKFSNIIMMEYIKGETLQTLAPNDYDKYSKQVIKFVLVTLLMNGLCHGDLHVGNILFIKDENDLKYKYKIGILDFGIIYEIDKLKNTFYYIFANMCSAPPKEIAQNLLLSGIIEPVDCIKNLSQTHFDSIVNILTNFINNTIHVSKHFSQVNTLKSISELNDYIVNNNLTVNGFNIRPCDDLIKFQVIFSMLYGVIFKLCGQEYIEITNKVMIDLFHIDVSES